MMSYVISSTSSTLSSLILCEVVTSVGISDLTESFELVLHWLALTSLCCNYIIIIKDMIMIMQQILETIRLL